MARKTVSLLALIEQVNQMNRESTCAPDIRMGWNTLLEQALMAANVYAGFGYYSEHELPRNQTPGLVDGHFVHGVSDDSRRFYYTHSKLKPDF